MLIKDVNSSDVNKYKHRSQKQSKLSCRVAGQNSFVSIYYLLQVLDIWNVILSVTNSSNAFSWKMLLLN